MIIALVLYLYSNYFRIIVMQISYSISVVSPFALQRYNRLIYLEQVFQLVRRALVYLARHLFALVRLSGVSNAMELTSK